jgi:NAD(P)-dependent dehydrogenase (short-subunit alcohol dehydrogenase family)
VHKWINNAGVNGGRRHFDELDYNDIAKVVNVNLLGAPDLNPKP